VIVSTEKRDDEAVRRFVERFAGVLVETGWPRMGARVFIALLATDDGGANAADLAEMLQVSPAAISGAVRLLSTLGLASREREPGSRRDFYRVHDDVWYEAVGRRDQVIQRWVVSLREGIDALGEATPAGRRLAETLSFFEFLDAELPQLFEKWKSQRRSTPEVDPEVTSATHRRSDN
jgi:DNA-binding transcriptional regulator GbsR (MarR family)